MSTQTRIGVRIDLAGVTSRADFTEDSQAVLQRAVCGDIEAVTLGGSLTMFANEDGIAQFGPLARNPVAEWIIAKSGDGFVGARIVGPVIFTGGVDDEGDTLGLSDLDLAVIEITAARYRAAVTDLAARLRIGNEG